MAIYRNVSMSFWNDSKVEEEFTPEDKYFYLYLLTNPQTNICGCYRISYATMVKDTGYSKDTIIRLIKRFDTIHKVIKFDEVNKEMLLLNWHKYNWTTSDKVLSGVKKIADKIKCDQFRDYIYRLIECYRNDQPPCSYEKKISDDAAVDDEENENNELVAINKTNSEIITDTINYLNNVTGSNYKPSTSSTKKLIKARIKDGFKLEDFKVVIDKKYNEWAGSDMEKYLRPETLFGNKFESYLNQKINNSIRKGENKQSEQLNVFLNRARGVKNNDRGRSS